MRVDRMRTLVTVLERVERLELPLDMSQWVEDWRRPYHCGTAACAVGWLARSPEAPELELEDGAPYYVEEGGLGLVGADAVAAYFEIDYTMVDLLFLPDSYDDPTIGAVLERVRHLVAQYPAVDIGALVGFTAPGW